MIAVIWLKTVAAGVAATLAACSATNMYQTHQLLHTTTGNAASGVGIDDSYTDCTSEQVVETLKGLKRTELFKIFLSAKAPSSIDWIQGEWNGVLLDNHSWVMTTVTAIITHKLFGRGRRWNGKVIGNDFTGINQFRRITTNDTTRVTILETAHQFQYQIGPTELRRGPNADHVVVGGGGGDDSGTSLKHDYAPHHPFVLSPWRSMKDELRWIPCASGKVMIGIGYFGWSGGVWNASPFLLYKVSSSE